jgi:hypothetical protein
LPGISNLAAGDIQGFFDQYPHVTGLFQMPCPYLRLGIAMEHKIFLSFLEILTSNLILNFSGEPHNRGKILFTKIPTWFE